MPVVVVYLPVNPAPAAPNNDVIIATPLMDAMATAALPPTRDPTPAAMKGAARPPVSPMGEKMNQSL